MILLTEIFLSEVMRIPPSISPLELFVSRHIDVLEILVLGVAVGARVGDGQAAARRPNLIRPRVGCGEADQARQ